MSVTAEIFRCPSPYSQQKYGVVKLEFTGKIMHFISSHDVDSISKTLHPRHEVIPDQDEQSAAHKT